MDDVIVGHGISLLRWRSGGVKHPHDMPPFRFPPSPTFGDSSAQGVTHDWSISRTIVETVRTPVILAGGLGPDNVEEAIRSVQPAGVDSKTKTDREGTHSKDLAKVEAFYRAAKSY